MKVIRKILLFGFLGFILIYLIATLRIAFAFTDAWERKNKKFAVMTGADTLYFQASRWGVAGDHEMIFLSNDSISPGETDLSVYTFYSRDLFYKYDNDTLSVYVLEAFKVPLKPFQTNVKVINLKDYNEVLHLKRTYSESGLKHVSLVD